MLIKESRPIVFEHISALLETAIQYSVLLIERAIVGLFRLTSLIINKVRNGKGSAAVADLNVPLALHARPTVHCSGPCWKTPVIYCFLSCGADRVRRRSLDPNSRDRQVGFSSDRREYGLMVIRFSSQTEWRIVFSIFRGTVTRQEAAKTTFQIVTDYVQDGSKRQVTVDSFPGLISILDEYAGAASVLINSKKRGPGGRRQQQPSSQKYVPAGDLSGRG